MRNLLIIYINIFIYISSNVSFAQWSWSNPNIQNNNLKDIHIFNTNEALAVGEVGSLLRTTNNGVTWDVRQVTSGFYEEFNSIVFSDYNTGWICGQGGLLLKTVNNGFNWSQISSPTSNDLRKIFRDATNKFWCVGDNGTILYSDGGEVFSPQNSTTLQNINNVFFLDSQRGYAVANKGIVLKTTNGGLNWTKLSLPLEKNLYGVHFPSYNTGYVVGDSGRIFKTTNGGTSWNMIAFYDTLSITTSDLKSVYFLDENRGWVAGKEARIFYTSNGGISPSDWTFQNVSPYWRLINTIKFINSSVGYCVGEWGTILKTVDGGQFWSVLNNGNDEILNKVFFINENIGWVAGDRGTILKTTNGGSLWFKTPVFNYWQGPMTADINSIQFLDTNNGFAIGDSSYFSYTTNGGNVWYFYHYDSLDRMKDLWGVHFLDNYNGVVVGGYYNSNPVFLRTSNRGQSWHILKPSDAGYKNVPVAVKMLDYNEGWASCKEGILRFTTNGGYAWSFITPLPSYGNDYNDLFFLPGDSVGWTIGKNGLLLKTTNRGLSWFMKETGTTKELHQIFFINRNVGFIVGEIGLILKSTDGGESWVVQKKMTNLRLKSVYMLNENTAFVVGEYGLVFKTTNGGATFVNITDAIPKDFNLKQNYPNPFNSTTKLDFVLNRTQNISLKVYSILGQELYTIFNGVLNTGEHNFYFNSDIAGLNLSSGIYLIRLKGEDYSKTIKAMLIK